MPISVARNFFIVLLLVSVALLIAVGLPLWKPLLLAAVLAGALSRRYEHFALRVRGRRGTAALLFTVAAFFLIVIPIGALVLFAAVQAASAMDTVVQVLREGGGVEGLIRHLPAGARGIANRLLEIIPLQTETLNESAAAGGKWAAGLAATSVAKVSSFAFHLIMMLIAFYFLLLDGPALVRWMTESLPLPARHTVEVLREFRDMSHSVIGSNLLTGAIQASVATLGFLIGPVPQPIFFGLLTFFMSFIPSVGTTIVTIPVGLFVLLSGRPWWGGFLLLWGGLVALVDNLMRPWLIRRGRVRLHGALVFFALIGGIAFFGVMGLVVGPLALTFFLTMIRLWHRDFEETPAPGVQPIVVPVPIAVSSTPAQAAAPARVEPTPRTD